MTTKRGFVALVVVAVASGTAAVRTQAQTPAADRLVVHEWGTFTSVQGSNGIALEGLQHEEERLPPFVYSRTEVRECPLRKYGYKGLEVPVSGVTQKMETPVIYFHSGRPRTLDVRVDFVNGLLTQWYPVSDCLGPPERAREEGPLDLNSIERSFLAWKIELVPPGSAVTPPPTPVAPGDPWELARAVDAATVRTLPRERPERMGPVESERYLFYRGLGTFALPVAVESAAGGRVVVRNGGQLPLPFAFVVEMKAERGRFAALGAMAGGTERLVEVGTSRERAKEEIVTDLKGAMAAELRAAGLNRDEAEAMVSTWSRAWFASEGTRVIYCVPRHDVDALLPLQIRPAPDEIVRVLVGRIEFMTPETETAVETALKERVSADAATRDRAMARLARLDRFLEPHVRRVVGKTADAAARKSGEDLLATLND